MGICHDTCAITRTAIMWGDEILLVKINSQNPRLKNWGTYTLLAQSERYKAHTKAYVDELGPIFDRIEVGIYNGCGDLEGNSSDYEEEFPLDDFFYAHKSVVELLLNKRIDGQSLKTDIYTIVEIAHRSRIQLAKTPLLGRQFFDRLEHHYQNKILAESVRILDRNLKVAQVSE